MTGAQPLAWWAWLPLLAACSARHDTAAVTKVDARAVVVAPVKPTIPALPMLLRARLDYMFEAAKLVRVTWPGMTPDETCVLAIDVDTQWVVNCAYALPGFAASDERYREHTLYFHAGGDFESAGHKHSTAAWLRAVPATAQVGANTTGLPGPGPWLVIGTLEALSVFHPAFEHATTEAWVSVAMHEFIHTHQLRAPGFERERHAIETRSSDAAQLSVIYSEDAAYRQLVAREYSLLVTAAERAPEDRAAALRALRSWWSLYRKRVRYLQAHHGSRVRDRTIEDDALFSYMEGTARFVESDFLANTSQHPRTSLTHDPRFHGYDQFIGRGYEGSPNRQLDTQYFYAIGYHVCVLLERVDPHWKYSVHTRSHQLFGIVSSLAAEGGGG